MSAAVEVRRSILGFTPAQRVAVGRAVAWSMAELGCGTADVVEDAWVSLSSLEAILDGRRDASVVHTERVLAYLGLELDELLGHVA